MSSDRSRTRRVARKALILGVTLSCLAAPFRADARSDYDPQRAGNPLRIVYYAVYPVAWLVDVLIFRPAYHIGQYEPFHTVFGTERVPPELSEEIDRERDRELEAEPDEGPSGDSELGDVDSQGGDS